MVSSTHAIRRQRMIAGAAADRKKVDAPGGIGVLDGGGVGGGGAGSVSLSRMVRVGGGRGEVS